MTRKHILRRSAWLPVLLATARMVAAQDSTDFVPPRIELSTDKTSYQLHEPVVLTVRLTNVSGRPQRYYALHPLSPLLRFQVVDPDGQPVNMYSRAGDPISGPDRADSNPPGGTASGAILLSHYYPLTAVQGTYVIEVGLAGKGPEPYLGEPAVLELQVLPPLDPDLAEQVIDPFGKAVARIRGQAKPNLSMVEALERVLSNPNPAVAYLVEPALYYLALANQDLAEFNQGLAPEFKIDVGLRRPLDDAVQNYEEFIRKYPASKFLGLARRELAQSVKRQQKRTGQLQNE